MVCFSQTRQIKIVDSKSGEPLTGAAVLCDNSGSVTDIDGYVQIDLGKCKVLTISYLGYKTYNLNATDITDIIQLTSTNNELDAVTVTGSRYERRMSESTVSVDVLKPALLNAINTSKSDEILNKVPGVQVVGGQANIRGGSGFSYGAGSRVMVLLDGLPALQGDAGLSNWGDMPIEHLDQIEILKGAASSMYGSSALNGVINFRRKKPTSTPSITAFSAFTAYGDPKDKRSKAWDYLPYRTNTAISYSQKVNKLDVGLHGFYSKFKSFNQDTNDDKIRIGGNTTYYVNDKLKMGVNVLYNTIDGSDFFIWQNAIRGIYRPLAGTVSSGRRTRFMIDPFLIFDDASGANHKVQGRIFYTNNNLNMNQSNTNLTNMIEYQYQRKILPLDVIATFGAFYSSTDSEAELFNDSTYLYQNMAVYGQVERQFGKKLSTSLGLRYEYNDQKSPREFLGIQIPNGRVTDGALVARAGINYALAEYTNLRASWGQGYRYPTITERFIRTSFGGFQIFPNPLLQPEFGFSTELAIKQGLKIGSIQGFLDIAGFYQEYSDMIEFSFQTDPLGFKPINVGNTRISGFETSFMGKFDIWKINFTTLMGYTYIDPIYKDYETNEQIKTTVSAGVNVLKYRSKHSAKIDIEGTFKNAFIGFSHQYYSHLINIDKVFEEPLSGLDLFEIGAFRRLNSNGFNVIDVRAGYSINSLKISGIISNLTNQLYTVRPGLAEAPINYTLRVDVNL
jgi:outer membrane receptor protein involved in Fe transport